MKKFLSIYANHKTRYTVAVLLLLSIIGLGVSTVNTWRLTSQIPETSENTNTSASPAIEEHPLPVKTPAPVQPTKPATPPQLPQTPKTLPTQVPEKPDLTPDIPPLANNSSFAPVIAKVQTNKRVVFMGVDDGAVKNPNAINYIKQHHYPFTLFLSHIPASENYDYFKPLVTDANNTVENHTIHHPVLSYFGYAAQKAEICGQSDNVKRFFGNTPTLFRPPYGDYNSITQRVVKDCGMKAIILWSAKVNDGKIQYQKGNHIVPGDIMLMHFRPKIMEDLQAFTNEIESQHLTVVKLEDWIR